LEDTHPLLFQKKKKNPKTLIRCRKKIDKVQEEAAKDLNMLREKM